jgi:hypothetical protein
MASAIRNATIRTWTLSKFPKLRKTRSPPDSSLFSLDSWPRQLQSRLDRRSLKTFYKVFTPALCPTLVDSRPLPTLDGVDLKHPPCSLANVHLLIRTPPAASLLKPRTAIAPLPQLDDVVEDVGHTLHHRPRHWQTLPRPQLLYPLKRSKIPSLFLPPSLIPNNSETNAMKSISLEPMPMTPG